MSSSLTVKFIDFWPSFDIHNNKFIDALRAKFQVTTLEPDNPSKPDLLFYSRCGIGNHYKYNDCVKIFYTGENDCPNFNECDYSISFHDIDVNGRNLRYPLYALEINTDSIPETKSGIKMASRGFCSLVMSNSSMCDPQRIRIIDAVNNYREIASGGKFRNNIGHRVDDKLDFLSQYKFNLALENSYVEGYVTEKIAEAFLSSSVPIYWGSKTALSDFNPASFINVADYATLDSLVSDIKSIDSDLKLYLSYLTAPSKLADAVTDFDDRLSSFLTRIASNPKIHRTNYGEMGLFRNRYSILHPLSHRRSFLILSKLIGRVIEPRFFK